ncbi:hypothetical protein ACE6H2_004969 [Prunus campanulata]
MAGTNDIKIKGLDKSDNSGNGSSKIEVDDVKAKGNKGNLKVLTDFAQRGKVGESGYQEITGNKPLQAAA